jgi:hypothetical protein
MLNKLFVFLLFIQTAIAGHPEIDALEAHFQKLQHTLKTDDVKDEERVKTHLAMMAQVDQDVRKLFMKHQGDQQLIDLMKSIDCLNATHLKAIIGVHGWPVIPRFGNQADHECWLLVQHADHDVSFQEQCLNLMKRLPEEETNKRNQAYLFDRIAVAKGVNQRYGTQVNMTDGALELHPYEGTLDELNQCRFSIGLEPIEDYLAQLSQVYKKTY